MSEIYTLKDGKPLRFFFPRVREYVHIIYTPMRI